MECALRSSDLERQEIVKRFKRARANERSSEVGGAVIRVIVLVERRRCSCREVDDDERDAVNRVKRRGRVTVRLRGGAFGGEEIEWALRIQVEFNGSGGDDEVMRSSEEGWGSSDGVDVEWRRRDEERFLVLWSVAWRTWASAVGPTMSSCPYCVLFVYCKNPRKSRNLL
ncbi:hypothetical protein ISN44_As03g034360 [Arabidopsis suecica]|uniref:Uncharacterized protein n=1 Tax=Arabidopsis suecica TaxID=45249 RepID=A0A8T2FCN1_ARASU|nr:hypothetical protein ISN44_As03g034360 [Arabidopsis suecica]